MTHIGGYDWTKIRKILSKSIDFRVFCTYARHLRWPQIKGGRSRANTVIIRLVSIDLAISDGYRSGVHYAHSSAQPHPPSHVS
jgi:hypothetical protein